MSDHYHLPIPDDDRRPMAVAWLLFAITALLISGLFVILILLSRMPVVGEWFPAGDFFRLAIVVHVDFSVLIWFAAIAAVFWTLTARALAWPVAWTAFGFAIAGSVMLAASPFQGGEAIMSNYIPVLDNTTFLAGLSVIGIGLVIYALRSLLHAMPVRMPLTPDGVLRFGVHSSVAVMVVAAIALVWSLVEVPLALPRDQYFETLFWGSGHVMQFAWTQLMLVAWLWLASASSVRMPLTKRLVLLLLIAGVAPVFLTIWGYLAFDVGSPQHVRFFIWLMAAGGGVAAGPIGLALVVGLLRAPAAKDLVARGHRATLGFSILLFGVGGALGFLIAESNTIIPAHYHGCIVAVTLTFMGLSLHLLPRLGFAQPSPRLVFLIPWVYGIGQTLHVIGLAISGGHGAQRKVAVAEQGLENLAQVVGMGVMGIGGLIAVVAGVMFLVAVGGALRRRPIVVGSVRHA